jgi:hypothetical protein
MSTYSRWFLVVRRMIIHVRVVRILQCTLHRAVADGGRYILPLAFKLAAADSDYGRDLKSIMHRSMNTREKQCVMTVRLTPTS